MNKMNSQSDEKICLKSLFEGHHQFHQKVVPCTRYCKIMILTSCTKPGSCPNFKIVNPKLLGRKMSDSPLNLRNIFLNCIFCVLNT